MRTTRLLTAALAAAALLAGCDSKPADKKATAAPAVTRQFGQIAFAPCSLTSPGAAAAIDAHCATFAVPENRAAPNGRKIALNLAWLPATDKGGATADPVLFLAGGPGQAAAQLAGTVAGPLRDVLKQRDVVFVDQRGTGKSNPLDCQDATGKALTIADDADASAVATFAAQCAQGLAGKADPRFYTTGEAIADLDAIRAALGAEQVNLIGVSYGTRVAQQYAARYPAHTRAIVLDGVAPNDLVVGGEFARTFERALRLQVQQCQALPSCKARFPTDLRAQLRTLKTRLETAPVEVEYRDPATGASKRDTLNADTVVGLTHLFSYMPQMAALLPLVLDEAEHGRYASLMSLAQMMNQEVGEQMTRGMQWSVICAEDADRYRADPADADTVLGSAMGDAFFAACKSWPTGTRAKNFTTPLQSPVPALLVSGEIDPVTPPAYGERVLKGLPKGRHLVLDGQGHNVLGVGCMPKLVGQFIEAADAKALDTKCLDAIGYVPPFTTFNGWEP
ncbi:alpha/beta hydrolase [Lysobacter koreensis]|uniref:Alpha/beta hydrolase n=1 Tax=Lysobacter koreensis TaxID=266122 RepID=A0ABW2YMN9_9GAMM